MADIKAEYSGVAYQEVTFYIKNLQSGSKVTFTSQIPDEISTSYQANFDEQTVKNRSTPIMAYVNSGPKVINFTVMFSRDYTRNCDKVVSTLEQFFRPYKSTYIKGPKCKLVIVEVINVNCVPTSFEVVRNGGIAPDGHYRIVQVSMSFTVIQSKGKFSNSATSVTAKTKKKVSKKVTSKKKTHKKGQTYKLSKKRKCYKTATEASNKKAKKGNKTKTLAKGSYKIQKVSKGCIKISGWWTKP